MKKTLVAVAALVATGAFAQVTISGVVEAGILMPASGANKFASGGNGGSEITFGVSEDLGSGLNANASITMINNPFSYSDSGDAADGAKNGATLRASPYYYGTASNAVRTYNSFIGLSNDIGSLKLGSQFTPAFFVATSGDPFGQAVGTFNLAGTSAGTAHTFESITVAGSVSGVGVAYQSTVDNSVNSYSITYSAGGLNVGYAAQTNSSSTQTHIAGNYDFGMAKLYLLSKEETGKKSATSIGISAPVGPVSVAYSVSAKSGEKQNSNFGVFYPLSKRTTVGWVNYNSGDTTFGDGTTAVGNGNFVGIRHNF